MKSPEFCLCLIGYIYAKKASLYANGQAPGPPGLWQLPQGLLGRGTVRAASLVVANTDNCLANCCEWHCGHSGALPERTRVSKAWPQSWQAYS